MENFVDRRVSLIIICFAFMFGIFINSMAEAQTGGWKLVKKSTGMADYVSVSRAFKNDYGTNIVHYSRVTKYVPPKPLKEYGTELPVSQIKTHGTIDCLNSSYSSSVEGFFDKNGKKVNAKQFYKLRAKGKPFNQGSFEEGVFKMYCNPQNIAKAKQQIAKKEAIWSKQTQKEANIKRAELNKLKKYFQPKVKEYGTVSNVMNCKEHKISGCDYKVSTTIKILGNLPAGVISGMVPVYYKGNVILFKDGKIVSVTGDGKEKDVRAYYDKKWGRKSK